MLRHVPSARSADLLVPRLRTAHLLAIEAEDHYLRVHTDSGSDLILMRMTDACAMLTEVPGARVHRSWWVAQAAVNASEHRAGRMTLDLASGLQVPVSRSMQLQLKHDDWFAHAR